MKRFPLIAALATFAVSGGCNTFADLPTAPDSNPDSGQPATDGGNTSTDSGVADAGFRGRTLGGYRELEFWNASFEVPDARQLSIATVPDSDFEPGESVLAILDQSGRVSTYVTSLSQPSTFAQTDVIDPVTHDLDIVTGIDVQRSPTNRDEVLVAAVGSPEGCLARDTGDQKWALSQILNLMDGTPRLRDSTVASGTCAKIGDNDGTILPTVRIFNDVTDTPRAVFVESTNNSTELVSLRHSGLGLDSMIRTTGPANQAVGTADGVVLFDESSMFTFWAGTLGEDDELGTQISGQASQTDVVIEQSDREVFAVASLAGSPSTPHLFGRTSVARELVVSRIDCVAVLGSEGLLVSEIDCGTNGRTEVVTDTGSVSHVDAVGTSFDYLATFALSTAEPSIDLLLHDDGLAQSYRLPVFGFGAGTRVLDLEMDAYSLGSTDFVVTIAVLTSTDGPDGGERVYVWSGRFGL